MDTVLSVSNLSKRYGSFRALDHLSLSVPKGAIYGLVGKNGAGKTTLLRVICGLQHPSKGGYALFGAAHDSPAISDMFRRVGAVIESPAMYPDLSAQENLKQQYRVLGLPSFDGIDELLALAGLSQAGRKKAKHFSMGMKQRLGIAMALAGDPDLLVLDEPVNGLDPQGIIEMRELMLRLNREKQMTILLSSHLLDELSRIATHYGFIDSGRMIRQMTAEEFENASRKRMHARVSDVRALARVLDTMHLPYEICSEAEADVFAHVSLSALAKALDEEGAELYSLQECDESLESFFLTLVGGAQK